MMQTKQQLVEFTTNFTEHPPLNESGFALVSSMIFLVLLTVIGIAAINTASIETMISASEKNRQRAFYAAEAGIEHGKAILMDRLADEFGKTAATNWDVALSDTEAIPENYIITGEDDNEAESFIWIQNRALGTIATYTVMARDNDDGDGNAFSDADNIIYLTSIATLSDGSSAGIEIGLSSVLDSGAATGYAAQAGSGSGKSYKSDDAGAISDFSPQTSITPN